MNKVVLIGRLTKDPELRFTPGNGNAVCSLTLAVDRYNSKTGEHEADFIPVVIWGKQAESTANYMLKGRQMAVSGRIQTRSYDAKDGTKRYVTEVIADAYGGVKFLGSKSDNNNNQNNNDVFGGNSNYSVPGQTDDLIPIDDGDMPF